LSVSLFQVRRDEVGHVPLRCVSFSMLTWRGGPFSTWQGGCVVVQVRRNEEWRRLLKWPMKEPTFRLDSTARPSFDGGSSAARPLERGRERRHRHGRSIHGRLAPGCHLDLSRLVDLPSGTNIDSGVSRPGPGGKQPFGWETIERRRGLASMVKSWAIVVLNLNGWDRELSRHFELRILSWTRRRCCRSEIHPI
jgi:hypothetical protein